MRHLVLFASPGIPGEPYRTAYERALDAVPGADMRWIVPPKSGNPPSLLSEAFKQEAYRRRSADGRVLPGLVSHWAPDVERYDTVSFVGFSAGCWLARDGLYQSVVDRRELAVSVLLDGAHTPTGPDGRPRDTELAPFLVAARDHRVVVVHSDTPTVGYSSTTDVARALAAAGSPAVIVHRPGRHHHGDLGGPAILSDYLAPALLALSPPVPPDPWEEPGLSWGERAVIWSLEQVRLGDVERPPGSNGGPYIADLFSPARRRAQTGAEARLGIRAGAWCSVAACAAAAATAPPGAVWPHAYRVSGVELLADARRLGTYRPPDYRPVRGDLCILDRAGASWMTHTVRIIAADGDMLRTIGGNEGERWRVTERDRRAETVIGFVAYPGGDVATTAGPSFRGTPRRLDPLRDVMGGDGMDEVAALIARIGDGLVG